MWRATVKTLTYGRVRYEGSAPEVEERMRTPSTIQEHINKWEDAWPLDISFFPNDGEQVAAAIREGTALAVADGSYQPRICDDIATGSWVIHCPQTKKPNCRGVCRAAGTRAETNAYRGELQSIHAGLLGIKAICDFHKIETGEIRFGCDCKTAIGKVTPEWLRVAQRTKHVDLIRAVRRLVKDIPVKIKFEHVDGHQDRLQRFKELGVMAQLNVMMDTLAKRHLKALTDLDAYPEQNHTISWEGWECWVDDTKITSDPGPAIRKSIFGKELKAFLVERGRISSTGFDLIDWEAIGDTGDTVPTLYRLWVTKHVSGFCGVGKMMKIMQFWEHDKCPCCQEPGETTFHVVWCPDKGMANQWEDSMEELEMWMSEEDTDPDLMDCISKTLAPRDPTSFELNSYGSATKAAADQDLIGWHHFTHGKIAKSWETAQHNYYLSIGSPKSGRSWAAGLVMQLYSMVHNQWTYRNGVLHEKDAQGLRIKEGEALERSIDSQFELGRDGLNPTDWHFIERGIEEVKNLHVSDKKA